MRSKLKEQLIRDTWSISNQLHNFIIDYEEALIQQGIDLKQIKDVILLLDSISKEV